MMDGYAFRAHLNAVQIGLRTLADAGELEDSEDVFNLIKFLAGIEKLSAENAVNVSRSMKKLAVMATDQNAEPPVMLSADMLAITQPRCARQGCNRRPRKSDRLCYVHR